VAIIANSLKSDALAVSLSAIPSIVGVANAATTFSGLGQFTNRRSRVNQVPFCGRRCLLELDFRELERIVDNLSKTRDLPQLLAVPWLGIRGFERRFGTPPTQFFPNTFAKSSLSLA
jgi:hypothetical protein